MPSPLAHSLAGCIYSWKENRATQRFNLETYFGFVFLSNLPDMHYIPALLLGSPARFHYAFLHAPFFGLTTALILFAVLEFTGREERSVFWSVNCFLLYSIHVLMDYFCRYRHAPGVMLFWPFRWERYTSPWPIFFELRKGPIRDVLVLENLFILMGELLICGAVFAGLWLWEKRRRKA